MPILAIFAQKLLIVKDHFAILQILPTLSERFIHEYEKWVKFDPYDQTRTEINK